MRRRRPAVDPAWLEDVRVAGSRVVSVCHPHWRGVRAAARAFRAPVLETADASLDPDGVAGALAEAGVEVMVLQGFPPWSELLLRAARSAGLETRCVLHSSVAQHGADAGEAEVADHVVALVEQGVVGRVGFVKEGVAEVFRALGVPAEHVPNRVPELPAFEPVDLGGDHLDVGLFAEPYWRKNVSTQLAAVALLDRGRAHLLRAPAVHYLSRVPAVAHGELPWEEFVRLQGSVDLNLYVTLSECHPLSPIESYLAGVPCLTSRTSAVFRSDPELWTLTTVAEADNPRAIAAAARRLLAARDDAVTKARAWMDTADRDAAERWDRFVR